MMMLHKISVLESRLRAANFVPTHLILHPDDLDYIIRVEFFMSRPYTWTIGDTILGLRILLDSGLQRGEIRMGVAEV